MYWFVHLGTITELNGWDAMTPGHLDQHLQPFYEQGIAAGTLTRDQAKELIACFWIKVNNHPAPPKVGVTAKESGTYNDFTNINLGGHDADGGDGACEVSYIVLEVVDELHLLQPQASVHISAKTPDRFLKAACRVIRKGYGYPSVFNADESVMEMLRVGKSARGRPRGRVQRLHRDRRLRQGGLHPHRLPQRAQGAGARAQQRCRPADRAAGRPGHGRPAHVQRISRQLYAAFEPAARLGRGPEGAGQQLHRAHVRRALAGALPLGRHQRLHRQGPRLLRRRAALQHQLHPVLRHRHGDRQPLGHQHPRLRGAQLRAGPAAGGARRELRGRGDPAAAAAQPHPLLRQRRRPRRHAHAPRLRLALRRPSTAARTPRARTTT